MKKSSSEKLLEQAKTQGRNTLTEAESKKLLADYGVPVVKDKVATSLKEALACAQKIGFPVVVKGHGAKLTHKTERGLVRINLKTAGEVREAFQAVKTAAGRDWEGCLVAPFVQGRREFLAGLIRDAQFGPVVMFGLGGIFTEALADASFRIAPVDEKQARRMIEEISSKKLLAAFRGEAAASSDQLVKTLMGLSNLGLAEPGIKEVDINPLIITPRGKVVA